MPSSLEAVQLSAIDSIAVLTINNPPVNALSPGVPEAILDRVDEVNGNPAFTAAVLIGAGKAFIAGADIKEFVKITSGSRDAEIGIAPLLNRLEDSPKPLVAAIHGSALGGGLEVAMACHYRVSTANAQLGQPEVKLGLIPGAGGTQRLPRLIGNGPAARMCTFGEAISGSEALSLGLVDKLIDGDLLLGAVAYARTLTAPRRTRERTENLTPFTWPIIGDRFRGREAPMRACQAIEATLHMSFEQGLAEEARLFRECLFSAESRALIHVFFAERQVAKVPGVREIKDYPVRRAVILGAGTMGTGIAMTYLNAGIPVTLTDSTREALDKGVATIRGAYDASLSRRRVSPADIEARLSKLTPALGLDAVASADIVVEAAWENMALKKEIFAAIDRLAPSGTILATNTSSLSIDEIASATSRPESVIGHHFFSPAHIMKLVEIVRGAATAPEVVAASLAIAKRLGKIGVVVGNCRGFVGNRMFHAYRRQAQFLVEEGASPVAVDKALTSFGMAMGPLAVGDLAGLDVGYRIRREYAHLDPPGVRKPLMEDRLVEMGRHGQKTRAGWYLYDEHRTPSPDPAVEVLAEEVARQAGIRRREIGADEIRERCLYALINEGCKILGEGIANRSSDIDVIYVNGYGFPGYRGGPMKYAELTGWKTIHERVAAFHAEYRDWWEPAALLASLAAGGAERAGAF